MYRITHQAAAEAISAGFSLLPIAIRERLKDTHFLDQDPGLAGLHAWKTTGADARPYSETAHCVWPAHLKHLPASRRRPVVVLPTAISWQPWIVVHELGHALDWLMGCRTRLPAINAYAQQNRLEAYAEAFRAWVMPDCARFYETSRWPEIARHFEQVAA